MPFGCAGRRAERNALVEADQPAIVATRQSYQPSANHADLPCMYDNRLSMCLSRELPDCL